MSEVNGHCDCDCQTILIVLISKYRGFAWKRMLHLSWFCIILHCGCKCDTALQL